MAKTSMINRDLKRAKLVKRHAAKRVELKKIVSSPTASYDEKVAAAVKRAREMALLPYVG